MKQTTTQKLLMGVVIVQAFLLAGHWFGQPAVSAARGDVTLSNPSERQLQMVDELKSLNEKMDKLTNLLAGGEVTVKVAKEEK